MFRHTAGVLLPLASAGFIQWFMWWRVIDCVYAGTPHKDTVCELCADGHFADVTQENTTCVTHSACEDHKLLLLPGSRWHDSVCATCDHHDHTPKGTLTHTFTIRLALQSSLINDFYSVKWWRIHPQPLFFFQVGRIYSSRFCLVCTFSLGFPSSVCRS